MSSTLLLSVLVITTHYGDTTVSVRSTGADCSRYSRHSRYSRPARIDGAARPLRMFPDAPWAKARAPGAETSSSE